MILIVKEFHYRYGKKEENAGRIRNTRTKDRQFKASLLLLHQIPQPQADKIPLYSSQETLTAMMLPTICSDL